VTLADNFFARAALEEFRAFDAHASRTIAKPEPGCRPRGARE